MIHSQVFPGLWLAVPALLAGEMAQVLSVEQKGLDTVDHRAFVDALTIKLQGS